MKVGFAELGKKIILSEISWKDMGERKDPKDILERFGRIKRSKRYPRKIWCGQKIQKISSKDLGLDKRSKSYHRKILGWTKDPKFILERLWGGQRIQNDQDL